MTRLAMKIAGMALAVLLLPQAALAQEAPAVAKATGADKERLKGLIEQAKKEGAVSYIDGLITPGTHDKLSVAFKKYYGLPDSFKVGNTYGAPVTIITRLNQEMRADRYTMDVVGVASPAWVQGRVAEGKVMEYDSPEYGNYKQALDQKMGLKGRFIANAAYTFAPTLERRVDQVRRRFLEGHGEDRRHRAGGPVQFIRLRGLRLDAAGLHGRPPDRQPGGLHQTRQPQAGVHLQVGADSGPARVCEDMFAMYGLTSNIPKFNERGAKLQHLKPKEGYVLLPQVMFITAGAPHPAAAKLWFDFVLSQEGQEIFVQSDSVFSVRSGFKSPRPEIPPIDQMKSIPMDWLKITEADLQKTRNEWLTMFKGGKGKSQ